MKSEYLKALEEEIRILHDLQLQNIECQQTRLTNEAAILEVMMRIHELQKKIQKKKKKK